MHSVALAVVATVGAMSLPAQAQDQEPDRQESRAEMREERQEMRAQQQEARQAPQAAAPQQQAQVADRGRNWNRGNPDGNVWQGRAEARRQQAAPQQPSSPDDGWRSQRAVEGQRYGRNWDNGGAVGRPAPALRGAEPQVPDRGTADHSPGYGETRTTGEWATRRNRTYSDPNRTGTYGGDHDNDHDHSADIGRDRRDQTQAYRSGYNGGYNGGYTSGSRDHHRWDHDHWRRDTRYNWSGYRSNHRDLYRAGRYYSPYNNYRYSRLNIGIFLNSGFYGNRYWINDPWQYRLPEVYGPYRWVRYYDDVLLVDIYSGEVVDVIHNFFW